MKNENNFAKEYTPNCFEEVFVKKKLQNTTPQTYIIIDLYGEENVGAFYKKELHKANQKEFRIEKVIHKKFHRLNVKWKGYDNSFNSCTNKIVMV